MYPNIFSFEVNNLFGSYDNNYHISYNDNSIEFNLYNQGWAEQTFVYQLMDVNENVLITNYETEIVRPYRVEIKE